VQFSPGNPWDLKFALGGLVDIEFIAQTLQLCTAPGGADVLDTNTIAALGKLAAAGTLREDDSNALQSAATLQQALTQALRIALDGSLDPATATPGLKGLLVRASGLGDFSALEKWLAQAQSTVREIYERVLA
jgi:glutamate-ammonia-ligase adenylyltransferase